MKMEVDGDLMMDQVKERTFGNWKGYVNEI